ncbi:MAG TPA: hypothetical protein VL137_03365 [Polyangiaceae bacterium]|nr:hypothetical protein [Polyangiaceae bacterium]
MHRIRALFEQQRTRIASHPFFAWLAASEESASNAFVFTPVMVDFTMGFADMNKWFFSYPNAQSDFERAINQHTQEDRTHSRLFLENWCAFGLDQSLQWPTSKTLWWLYHSEETLPVRHFGWEIMGLAATLSDPLPRFALMEAIEICGDIFFRNSARVATKLSARTGVDYRYYGEYHQLRETGHLHTDESPFFAAQLSTQQLAQAHEACLRIFNGFERVLDQLLSYCLRASSDPNQLKMALDEQYQRSLISPPVRKADRLLRALGEPRVARSQAPLLDYLNERKNQLQRHPFVNWLAQDSQGGIETLQSFSALWAIDITGYPDFNRFALTYPASTSEAQLAINQVASALGTHGVGYLRDWKALELDELLKWSPGDAISFYFLSEQTEIHRRNLAKVTQLAFRNPAPLWRLWLMVAFESGGDPLFDALAPHVERAERTGSLLNYWAERHCTAGSDPNPGSLALLAAQFDLEISAREQHQISEMIGGIFDNFEEQFSLSHQEANRSTFLKAAGSLPPAPQPAPRWPAAKHTATKSA